MITFANEVQHIDALRSCLPRFHSSLTEHIMLKEVVLMAIEVIFLGAVYLSVNEMCNIT